MSVKVVRERSDQRRHHRVTAPLFVAYAGHTIKVTDWSLGGLRIDNFPGLLPDLGTTIALHISIPFQGFDVSFDCDAEVARRIESSGTLAVKYTRIGDRELGLMEHFIDELIRGSMVDVKDTIQRIDLPVTPASTKPDVNPLSKIPIGRWPTRTIAFAALYLTIGLFVFGYAGVIAYTNFVRMEVDSAVIASPLESVRSQVNGRIIYGKYRQGDQVPKGALLLSVVDNDLERQIDMATIDIKDKAAQAASHERMLIEELSRVDAFAKVESKNIDQIGLEVQSLEAQIKAAQALHERLNHLFKQGFTTATLVENAEKQMIAAQKLAQAKRVELQTRQSLATYNAGERLYNGQTFFGDRAKIESQTVLAREHVAIAEKKLQALLDHRDRLAIYAPYAGMLQELPRPDGSMVRLNDVLAIIENPRAREIWAFLRQDEVLSVGLGDEVKIYLPGLSELRKARVMRIDRTIGFVSEMNSTYIWRAPRDRSAKVILEFLDTGTKPQDESYRTGMPAVAIFSTRPTNYLVGDMMHRFRMVFGGRPRKGPEGTTTTNAGGRSSDKEPRSEATPGTSNRDRLGPPANYAPSANPLRDLDAVAARRLTPAPRAEEPFEMPALATTPPAASQAPAGRLAGLLGDWPARAWGAIFGVAPPPTADASAQTAPGASQPVVVPPIAAPPVAPPPGAAPSAPTPKVGAWPERSTKVPAQSGPAASEPRARAAAPTRPRARDAGADDDEDERPATPRSRPSAMTAGPAGSPSQGIFARMAERLRAVFAVKPADDDDDWGDDAGLATASPEPSAPAPAAKPVGKSKPSRGGMGADASGASSAPSLHPAIEEDMTVKPAWQERLRRSRTAERLP